MNQRLANRVRAIAPSATISVDTKTKALIKEGKPVINMSVGEPDFDTPAAAALAGIRAITNGQTRYTPTNGTVELRKAIAHKLLHENGLEYTQEQIVVSSGAKHSLYNVFLTICDPGDEVILPAPYWVSYPEQIQLAGGKPVIVTCDESTGFKMTAAGLKNAITDKTKAIILNSPSNPTGAVYSEAELKAIGEVLVQHDIYVITDEIYERLVYGDVRHISLPTLFPELLNRSIVVNGFSKAFAMTGWRLGYIAAPLDVAKAVSNMQSHATGNPSSVSQAAGAAALSAFDPSVVKAFHERRDAIVKGLQSLPGVECLTPDGAFYVFPNIRGLLGKSYRGKRIDSSAQFCDILLEEKLVSTVPGEAFGAPNNIRLSYAVSLAQVNEATVRISEFVNELV